MSTLSKKRSILAEYHETESTKLEQNQEKQKMFSKKCFIHVRKLFLNQFYFLSTAMYFYFFGTRNTLFCNEIPAQ